ncbi:MAG TPA: OmpA family protein [Rhizobiaceae bacterium]|nr:OmpA family protein [Rhizobiaceae bacterium]
MKRHSWILAGTALGLLMAAPLAAAPAPNLFKKTEPLARDAETAPLILAQARENEEELRPKRRGKKQGEESGEEAPAAEEAPAEQAPAEAAPAEPAPAPRAEEPAPEAAPEPEAPAEREAPRAEEPQAEEPAPAEEEAPRQREAPAEEAPAEPEAPAAQEPTRDAPAADEAPADEAAPKAERERPKNREKPAKRGEEPAAEEAPAEEAPAEPEAPAGREAPVNNDVPADVEMTPDGSETAPADRETAPADESRETRPEGEAPVLDSQKETAPAAKDRGGRKDAEAPAEGEAAGRKNRETRTDAPAEAEVAPPPENDAAAQPEEIRPRELEAATSEEGRRIERRPEDPVRERPEGTEVLREIGDRIVVQFGANVFVESNDRPRIARGAREVYYEELPRGRVREVIIRENGVQIITVRNRYGDVIRRTRVAPDGREYVLVYVEEDNYDRVVDWRDPGLDLPPMRLTIPVEDYILESERVDDPDVYYAFLEQPPVERVERLYSIDEVKRSARIRDKTRRIDLDTINFEFGSAEIADSEVEKLAGVADAMQRLLEKNPAETFLIEGHTDAVGSDMANLALSDQRAEAVAAALTNVFEIPPENLATQGYGEQYLKVNTESQERENRRVAMRRITPLVAPVASAN